MGEPSRQLSDEVRRDLPPGMRLCDNSNIFVGHGFSQDMGALAPNDLKRSYDTHSGVPLIAERSHSVGIHGGLRSSEPRACAFGCA